MLERKTHYPNYDVLALQDEWDDITREIVLKRLGPFPKSTFLTKDEQELILIISQHILYDDREEILQWVLHHCEQQLQSNIGEGERKPDTPPERDLIKNGLKAIHKLSIKMHGKEFTKLDPKEQHAILAALQQGNAENIPEWLEIPQKDLFNKLGELTTSAYYSHPTVWAEIGYGGPAYPRGYYRIEFGLADPWEPKKVDTAPSGFGEESDN